MPELSQEEMRHIITSHLARRGWGVSHQLSVDFEDTENLARAFIDLHRWRITEIIDPKVGSRLENLLTKENMSVDKNVEKLLCAVCDHEESHWSVCPYDRDYTESILFGTAQGLKIAGIPEKDVPLYTPDVANMFMDYILNAVRALDRKVYAGFDDGLSMFYLNQLRLPRCTPGYVLFVDAQMKIWGSSVATPPQGIIAAITGKTGVSFRTMAETHKFYKRVAKDAKRLAEAVMPQHIADDAYNSPLDAVTADKLVDDLLARERWERKARDFAYVYAPYLKHEVKPGDGKNSREQETKNGKERPAHPGGDFMRRVLNDPKTRKEIVKRAMEKGRSAGSAGMPYFAKQESFASAYEIKAEEIVINRFQDDDGMDPPSFDLLHMRDRRIDDDSRCPRAMHWAKTYFVPGMGGDETWLHQKEVPYTIDEQLMPGRRSLEDILFVVDTSGSMDWSGKPLDGSKYDLALRAAFGVIKYLETIGRAAHAKFGAVLFSDNTVFSGWEEYGALDNFKRTLFEGHQGGSTEIDAKVMDKAISGNKRRFLTLLISDGDIQTPDAAEIFKRYIDKGNDVIHFSIQGDEQFNRKLKQYGGKVIKIRHQSDLTGLILDAVRDRYNGA